MLTENTENIMEEKEEISTVKPSKRKEKAVENKNIDIPSNDTEEEVVDGVIDLSATKKKRFKIVGAGNGVLELNTSDMTVITRLENLYPKLQKLSQEASIKQLDKNSSDDEDVITKVSQALIKIDAQMRAMIDEIFDSNVSEVCAPNGSMFDPFNGEFRFEHIITVISRLYENNLESEFKKLSQHMKKHTSKYTKGR